MLAAAALIVVLVAGGAIAVAATAGLGPTGDTTAPPVAADPDPTAPATASPSAPATGEPGTASSSPEPVPATRGNAAQIQQQEAVTGYYALVPDQLAEGWARLTPSYQQNTAGGFAGYTNFWSAVDRVAVTNVSARAGDTVAATVIYTYRDGRTVAEQTTFTMALRDGTWKIDNSTVGSSRVR